MPYGILDWPGFGFEEGGLLIAEPLLSLILRAASMARRFMATMLMLASLSLVAGKFSMSSCLENCQSMGQAQRQSVGGRRKGILMA
jgi:hypothetical protein